MPHKLDPPHGMHVDVRQYQVRLELDHFPQRCSAFFKRVQIQNPDASQIAQDEGAHDLFVFDDDDACALDVHLSKRLRVH